MSRLDLLGRELTPVERDVLEVYEKLKQLAAAADAAPCVRANARHALAAAWQMVNDLDLEHEPLDHLGV